MFKELKEKVSKYFQARWFKNEKPRAFNLIIYEKGDEFTTFIWIQFWKFIISIHNNREEEI